jgi:hypothetical protein
MGFGVLICFRVWKAINLHEFIVSWRGSMMFKVLRVAYGLLLVAVLFVPFGAYHSRVEPYISGFLWGYQLPVGYVALVSGLLVILYPRLNMLKGRLDFLVVAIGLFLLLSFILFPKEFFINLLHGTSFSAAQIDVDSPVGNVVVWGLSLLSLALGFVLRAKLPRTMAN